MRESVWTYVESNRGHFWPLLFHLFQSKTFHHRCSLRKIGSVRFYYSSVSCFYLPATESTIDCGGVLTKRR